MSKANKLSKEQRRWRRAYLKKKKRGWRAIAKNDHDWDYEYLLDVLRFKLHSMSDFFDGPLVVQDKSAPEYQECSASLKDACDLCDTIVADSYEPDASIDAEYHRYDVFSGDNLTGNNAPETLRKKWLKACADAERQKQSDIERLFSIIGKYLGYWWD